MYALDTRHSRMGIVACGSSSILHYEMVLIGREERHRQEPMLSLVQRHLQLLTIDATVHARRRLDLQGGYNCAEKVRYFVLRCNDNGAEALIGV
jgi:hypothetical protein